MKYNLKIPESVQIIIRELEKYGYEAYAVGGCVRDSILGRTPHDWDICTSALPEETMEVFKDFHVIPTGLKHGTVTLLIKNEAYEITTYRIDGQYSDSRHPDDVKFTSSLDEDLARRDFTINAIALTEHKLIDPFGGVNDIENKIIKCVGNAAHRFEEDALRILRAIRFACQLNFEIEPDTELEIRRQRKTLNKISAERINSELCKMIICQSFYKYLLKYSNVFSCVITELDPMIGFAQNNPHHIYNVFDHTVMAMKYCHSDDLITKSATLFHDVGKPECYTEDECGVGHFYGHASIGEKLTDNIMRYLRFDNTTREQVIQLVKYHDSTLAAKPEHIKRWLNKIGEKQFRRLLDVKRADIQAQNPVYVQERMDELDKTELMLEEVIREKECFSLKDLAVNGDDLIAIGYVAGVELGKALKLLLSLVISDKVKNDRDELLRAAEMFRDRS